MKKSIICAIPSFIFAAPLLLEVEVINHSDERVLVKHAAPELSADNSPNLYMIHQDSHTVLINPDDSYVYLQTLSPSPFSLNSQITADRIMFGKTGSSTIGHLMQTVNLNDGKMEQYEYSFDHCDDWLQEVSHELEIQQNTILHRLHIH